MSVCHFSMVLAKCWPVSVFGGIGFGGPSMAAAGAAGAAGAAMGFQSHGWTQDPDGAG